VVLYNLSIKKIDLFYDGYQGIFDFFDSMRPIVRKSWCSSMGTVTIVKWEQGRATSWDCNHYHEGTNPCDRYTIGMRYICDTEGNTSVRIKETTVSVSTARLSTQCTYTTS
jgi:hypothetical protein